MMRARVSECVRSGAAVVVACVLLLACGDKDSGSPAAKPPGASPSATPATAVAPEATPELLARGEELFGKQCATCHGSAGRGDGPAAYLLYPRPRDLATALFRLVSTENRVPTDGDLFNAITRGIPRSAMPAWRHLPEADRWALVHHVRRLSREGFAAALLAQAVADDEDMSQEEADEIAAEKTTPGATWDLPSETPATLEALARGRQVYMRECAQCHDADGRGTGKDDLVDEKGVPIRPRNFTRGIFKGGKGSTDLARRILSGIPGTPMPSFAKSFGMEAAARDPKAYDLWATVHYVQSLVRPDAQELAQQTQKVLTAQRIDSVPSDAVDAAWDAVEPTYIALMHLWWSDDRPDGVLVRAVHDGKRLALHLTWEDRTEDGHVLEQETFADAAALQFSDSLDPPLFTMGSTESPVTIWHWKAHWQRDLTLFGDVEATHPNMAVDTYDWFRGRPIGEHVAVADVPAAGQDPVFLTGWGAGNLISTPDRKTSVESLVATGFGTLTSRPVPDQTASGGGVWKDSFWHVAFVRDLSVSTDGATRFESDKSASISFAVWDGSSGDRNGQKSVTVWHRINLE